MVLNPEKPKKEEIKSQLSRLYVDTTTSAVTALNPAMRMMGVERCVYGTDCGVPCSAEHTMEENRMAVLEVEEREVGTKGVIG